MKPGEIIGSVPTPKRGGYFICGPCNGRATKVVYLGEVEGFAEPLTAHSCDDCHARAERDREKARQANQTASLGEGRS